MNLVGFPGWSHPQVSHIALVILVIQIVMQVNQFLWILFLALYPE